MNDFPPNHRLSFHALSSFDRRPLLSWGPYPLKVEQARNLASTLELFHLPLQVHLRHGGINQLLDTFSTSILGALPHLIALARPSP